MKQRRTKKGNEPESDNKPWWLTINEYETGVIILLTIVLAVSQLLELSAKGLSYTINKTEVRSVFRMIEWILFR